MAEQQLADRLELFLARRLPEASSIAVADCQPLAGGYSRVMTRFTATIDDQPHELVLRADGPPGQALIETDRRQEWALLSTLTKQGQAPAPRALWADEDGHELGAKAIVIEFAGGGSFLSHLRRDEEPDLDRRAQEMCDLMAEIHRVDTRALPESIERPSNWSSYIEGLIGLWRQTEAELDESLPMLRYIAASLEQHLPPEAPLTLVHGEFQTANLVLDDDGRLLAVDWEFAHLGDPREDLGWARWFEGVQPPALIGRDEEAFCERYRERSGLGAEIINPRTVGYFSILAAIRVFADVLRQQQGFTRGTNTALRTAYGIGAVISAFEGWYQAISELESATEEVST